MSAPVKVVDLVKGVEQMMTMTAEFLGMIVKKKTVKNEDNFDCFQPRAGWWMPENTGTSLGKMSDACCSLVGSSYKARYRQS